MAAATFGSLFAGIGGFDLGLERAGMECRWQVEIDPYCQAVLDKRFPGIGQWDDVHTFPPAPEADWSVDVLCGGFPCQDISNAGRRAGIDGERSGLWGEYARIIDVLRPRFVIVENVDALAVRGLGRVLGDLAALGFDAEWDRIPAAAVGAPHRRWRIFIVAYAAGSGRLGSDSHYREHASAGRPERKPTDQVRLAGEGNCEILSHANGERLSGRKKSNEQQDGGIESPRRRDALRPRDNDVPDASCRWSGQRWRKQFQAYCEGQRDLFWPQVVPPVCGVVDGVPRRVDRLRGLGNAILPQIAEWIGRRIVESIGAGPC